MIVTAPGVDPLSRPTSPGRRRTPIEVAGLHFAGLQEACRHYGVKKSTYVRRMRAGYTLEQALGIEPRAEIPRQGLPAGIEPRSKPVTVRGVSYPSRTAAMRAHGVPAPQFYRRLQSGWSLEQALGLEGAPAAPVFAQLTPPFVVAGVSYPSLKALAQAYQLSERGLRLRMRGQPERALEELVRSSPSAQSVRQGRSIHIAGTCFPSLAAACRTHGIDVGVFYARRRSGWSEAQALGIEPREAKNGASRWPSLPVEVAGVTYASLREASQAHGLDPECVNSRLSNGWSVEEAFGLIPRKHKALTRRQSEAFAEAGVLMIGGHPFRWK